MKLVLTLVFTLTTSGCAIIFADRYVGKGGDDTVVICHNKKYTIEVPREEALSHREHGDTYGPC